MVHSTTGVQLVIYLTHVISHIIQAIVHGTVIKRVMNTMKGRTNMYDQEVPCYAEPTDDINHPTHYNTGNIETYDYIVDQLSPDEYLGYTKGNILKYVSRERHKGGLNDLRKAQWYLNKYIERMDSVDVNIAVNCGHQSIRRSGKYGTTATGLEWPEMKYDEQNKENTTEPRDNEKRWADVLERQLEMLERIYSQEDTTSQQKEPSCTGAGHECHRSVGDCR